MSAKEIRNKIKSIKSTQKITKAMEMVAASKVRRAQDNMLKARPYSYNIHRVMGHIIQASGVVELKEYLEKRRDGTHKIIYIVVSTDRGLCGGLNINLFKELNHHMRQQEEEGYSFLATTYGRKGAAFMHRVGVDIIAHTENLGDHPSSEDLIGSVRPAIDAFVENKVDAVYIVSNLFVNAMTQKPSVRRMLPLEVRDEYLSGDHSWDYLYEPTMLELVKKLIRRYIEASVKWAVAENIACEMSARMLAMKNATDNAEDLIHDLELIYNKARQGSITQELTEIVAGASAV